MALQSATEINGHIDSGMVRAIAAVSQNGVIGKAGGLPWNTIPWDKKQFLDATRGGTLILGRRTFAETRVTYSEADSLSAQTVVVTSRSLQELMPQAEVTSHWDEAHPCGVAVAPSVAVAVNLARRLWPQSPVWLCGGTRVYDEGISLQHKGDLLVREFHLTVVHTDIDGGDTFLDQAKLYSAFPGRCLVASQVESGGQLCSLQVLTRP